MNYCQIFINFIKYELLSVYQYQIASKMIIIYEFFEKQ